MLELLTFNKRTAAAFFLYIFCFYYSFAQTFERVELISGLGNLADNSGVAVADYDGDNDLDIFIVANAIETEGLESSFSKLYRNNNDGTFTDVTEAAGIIELLTADDIVQETMAQKGYKFGASWGDYNNDGFPDLFLTYVNKVQLWRNLGNGTFVNVTDLVGLNTTNNCINTSATWFDYNNDGFLDIYIADWAGCDSNSLYLNNNGLTFSDVTAATGLNEMDSKHSYSSYPFDINNDGYMDFVVTNAESESNYLYINDLGVSFNEASISYGLNSNINDRFININDFDLDGDFDFFITGVNQNSLLENENTNVFVENANAYNLVPTGWSWGSVFADFDLDGDEDVFIANGYDIIGNGLESNTYYRNLNSQGQAIFEDASQSLNLDEVTESVTAVDFDYDNDGDLDLLVTNASGSLIFYENKLLNFDDSNSALNWLKVKLEGTTSNRDALGAIITITTLNGTLLRHYNGVGFFSQNIQEVHFGISDATEVQTLQVEWPSGLIENYNTIAINTTIKLTEGVGIEVLNISPSQKIYGCTDATSCNYNPEATLDDGSCTYLPSQSIIGNTDASFLSVETYSYNLAPESTANWNVSGGEILEGEDTNQITVKWHLEESGSVSITESNSQCSSQEVTLSVNLGVDNLPENISVARLWNDALLEAIRDDFARPTVHARNLFHTSVAMYDIWSIYNTQASPYLIGNSVNNFVSELDDFVPNEPTELSIEKAISFAMYRLLSHRFQNSPGTAESQARFNLLMERFGYDTNNTSLMYQDGDAAAFGNYVAQTIIDYGLQDGSREATGYDNAYYESVNQAYALDSDFNPPINDPNRWQPLGLDTFIDQGGNLIDGNVPPFLSPEWGNVFGFALKDEDKITYQRLGNAYNVFHDPLDPPYISLTESNLDSDAYKWGFTMVSVWQSHLDQRDGVMWDISPASIGNVDIDTFPDNYSDYPSFYNYFNGGSDSNGHSINPVTGNPYQPNIVPRGDYARVLAEFWADGPDSETPPGHWFIILNYVNDHPLFEKRFQGQGVILDPLEWDVKTYFILGGGMHDAAISAWSVKGWYDYIRPISALRAMAERGQSTDNTLPNYDLGGLPLIENYIEIVDENDPLSGFFNQNVGKIKLYTWRGHDFIDDTETDQAGVGWILAEDWYPYQRPKFVTPPFAGFVSGHSTFSRTAAELLTIITGNPYFPVGIGEFKAKANEFLVFEEGPSVDVTLQWATYRDASDQTSLSRIWGGIHPPADDIPGRFIGQVVAEDVFDFAVPYFSGQLSLDDFNQSINIYPNSLVNNEVFITNTNGTEQIKVYDINGRNINIVGKDYGAFNKTTTLKFNNMASRSIFA